MKTQPATGAAAITPSDSTNIYPEFRALYVGGSGNISVKMKGGDDTILFTGVIAGTILPISVIRVYSTNTTATALVGLR